MKKQAFASLAVIALCFSFAVAGQKDSDKKKERALTKEEKTAPLRTEIAADAAKVRAALIRRELDRRWILGEDHPDKLMFREPKATGTKSLLVGDAHMRNIFTLASDGKTTTIYASVEFCVPGYECRFEEHRKPSDPRNYPWNQLSTLLQSVKEDSEGRQ